MMQLRTTFRFALEFILILGLLEFLAFVLFVYPYRNDEFGSVTNFIILYVVIPLVALGIAVGMVTYKYVSSTRRKTYAFLLGLAVGLIVVIAVPFIISGFLNFIV